MLDVNVWVVVDANGDYACHGGGAEEAMEQYDSDIGGHAVRRCIKVALKVPEPVGVVISGTVPDEAAEGSLTVG